VNKRLALLAVAAGVGKAGERAPALAKKFLDSIGKLGRDLGLPKTVDALKAKDIPELAKAACREADTNYPVPKYMSPQTCGELLRKVLPAGARPVKRAAGPKRRRKVAR